MRRQSVEVAPPPVEVSLQDKFGNIFEGDNIATDLPILDLKRHLEANSLGESDLKELDDTLRLGATKFNEKWATSKLRIKNLPEAQVTQVKAIFLKRRNQIEEAKDLVTTALSKIQFAPLVQEISKQVDEQNTREMIDQVEQIDKKHPIEALRFFEATMYEGYEKLSEEEKLQRMKILKAIHSQRLEKENVIMDKQTAEAITKNPYVDAYSDKAPLKWSDIKGMLEIDEKNLAYIKEKNEEKDFDLATRAKGDRGEGIEAQVAEYIVQYIPDVFCVIQSPRFSNADNVDKIDLIVVCKNPICSDVSDEFLMQGIEALKEQIEKQDEAVRTMFKNQTKSDNDYTSIIHTKGVEKKNNQKEKNFSVKDLSYYFDIQFVQVKSTDEGLKNRKKTREGVGGICWKESFYENGKTQYRHDERMFSRGLDLILE